MELENGTGLEPRTVLEEVGLEAVDVQTVNTEGTTLAPCRVDTRLPRLVILEPAVDDVDA